MFDTINILSESKVFPSKKNLKKFTARELSELAVLYFCSLYILYNKPETDKAAIKYVKQTIAHGTDFDHWSSYGNDLFVILNALTDKHIELDDPQDSDDFRSILPIGHASMSRWLIEFSKGNLSHQTHFNFFSKMDTNFRIKNQSIKAIKRLVMDWNQLNKNDRQLAMTRILQMFRNRTPKNELLSNLNLVATKYRYELHDVCDADTGRGCTDDSKQKELSGGMKFLATLGAFGLGMAASKALHHGDKK